MQSMIGHCLGAAGGLEAIATVKAITTGWLHPSINQFVSRKLALGEKAKRMLSKMWSYTDVNFYVNKYQVLVKENILTSFEYCSPYLSTNSQDFFYQQIKSTL